MPTEPQFTFDLGALEILIVFGIIMLLYGGKKLPEVARSIAQARKAFEDTTAELDKGETEIRKEGNDQGKTESRSH